MARPKSLALVAAEDEAARLRAQVYDLTKQLGEARAQVQVLTTQSSRLSDQRGRWEDLRSATLSARHILRDVSQSLAAAADNLHREPGEPGRYG